MVGDVHPAAGIGVLLPGAADVVVLLEDREVDAGLLQAVGGDDPAHPGADDGDVERPVRGQLVSAPLRGAQVVAVQCQLLDEHLHVLVHRHAAGEELDDRLQVGIVVDRRRAVVAEPAEHLGGQVTDRLLLLRGEAGLLRVGEQQRVDAQLGAQQRQVAGDVRQRGQQRRQIGVSSLARISSLRAVIGGMVRASDIGYPLRCAPDGSRSPLRAQILGVLLAFVR